MHFCRNYIRMPKHSRIKYKAQCSAAVEVGKREPSVEERALDLDSEELRECGLSQISKFISLCLICEMRMIMPTFCVMECQAKNIFELGLS